MSGEPSSPDLVCLLAVRLGTELRRRRREANLSQRALAARINYDRTYISQVEAGKQIPAEQFILLCEQALDAGGALRAVFGELLAEREAQRQRAHAERRKIEAGARLPAHLGGVTGAGLAETLGVDLIDLARAMQASHVSCDMLDGMESGLRRFHEVYAEVPPGELLSQVQEHLRFVTHLLQRSQPIKFRRRLCSVAGELAGLRAWLTFDLGDQGGAHIWYEMALQPADEADDVALCGWILGGRSLIPSYDGDPAGARDFIRRAQNYAGRSANMTARAWLAALEARAHAGMGDAGAFRHAQDRANGAIESTRLDERRHGMDFHRGRLNVAYYEGAGLVSLERPDDARSALDMALTVQGPKRQKARSIVLLAVATTHVQQREIDEACAVAGRALEIPSAQRIGPIEQRARDVMLSLEPWRSEPAVATFRDRLTGL